MSENTRAPSGSQLTVGNLPNWARVLARAVVKPAWSAEKAPVF
jgi:hypothetical protein